MGLPLKIAGRYLLAKVFSAPNAINILAIASLLAVAVITMACIVILSVLNGLIGLVSDLNGQINPDLKVVTVEGKFFEIDSSELEAIKNIKYIEAVSQSLDEVAMFRYHENQVTGVVRGVDSAFLDVVEIENAITDGLPFLQDSNKNLAVIGIGIAYHLGVNLRNPLEPLSIVVPQTKRRISFNPAGNLSTISLQPGGEFSVQKEIDEKYVFVPINVLRPVLGRGNAISSLGIKLTNTSKRKYVQQQIQELMGNNVEVLNKIQQNKTWYKVMRMEKWAAFAILILIMGIMSFNLLSSLSMMVMEKKRDISILTSMGMRQDQVGKVFNWLGLLIGLSGMVSGVLLAILFIVLQQQFGFIKMEGMFVVDSYPVRLKLLDVLLTGGCALLIAWVASLLPAFRAKKQALDFS